MNELIVSVSGLRGIVGETLTPLVAVRYAAAFAHMLATPGPIIISRDGRSSGSALAFAAASAVMASGREVLDADVAATPTTGVLVRQHRAAGGIQISASHNPPAYNGIKLFGNDGRVVNAQVGAAIASAFHDSAATFVEAKRVGSWRRLADTTSAHLERVAGTVDVDAIRAKGFRVLLDANHGAGAVLGRPLLEHLGCKISVLGEMPNGQFAHPPEPTAANLADVAHRAAAEEFDVTFCQDPDADRLAIIDARGSYIGEEMTLALTLENRLSRQSGLIVTNCSTSRMAVDIADKYGGQCIMSAVGEANVADLMVERHAIYGGEGNGGPIDPRVGYVRDSFVGMAQILELMAARDLSISQLAAAMPTYHIVKSTILISRPNISRLLNELGNILHQIDSPWKGPAANQLSATDNGKATINRQDGLRADWADRWVLVRGSNTEPIVRVVAEARTHAAAQQLCNWVNDVARSIENPL